MSRLLNKQRRESRQAELNQMRLLQAQQEAINTQNKLYTPGYDMSIKRFVNQNKRNAE